MIPDAWSVCGSPKSNAVRFPTDGQPTILSCTSAVAEQAFRKHAVNHSRVQLLVKLRRGRHVVDTKRFQRQPDCQAFLKSARARPNMPSAKTSSPMTTTQCQSPAALQVKATSKTLVLPPKQVADGQDVPAHTSALFSLRSSSSAHASCGHPQPASG